MKKSIKSENNKPRISLAGEFAVLSQLALLGKDANMTLGNTKGVDILVSDPESGKMHKLEVKTNYRNIKKEGIRSRSFGRYLTHWIMKESHENYNLTKDINLFYCFVNIDKGTKLLRFFIIPAKSVASYISKSHKFWLQERKKEGKKVKNTNMRLMRVGFEKEKYKIQTPTVEKYENNWDFKN